MSDLCGAPDASLSGDTVLIGAPSHVHGGERRGAAYVFDGWIPPIEVEIDIKPGNPTNPINPKSRGVIPVALLGSESLDGAAVVGGSIEVAVPSMSRPTAVALAVSLLVSWGVASGMEAAKRGHPIP